MSDEAIQIVITGRIDPKIVGSIRDIATEAERAELALDELRNTLRSFNPGSAFKSANNDLRELRNEILRGVQAQKTFADSNKTVKASLDSVTNSAKRYGQELNKIDGANVKITRSFTNLSGVVGTFAGLFGGIFAIQQYAQAQDALTSMQNKIKSLTTDTERQVQIQQQLFDVANRTRSGIEGTADGFVRFSKAMQDASDPEVLRFVETLNKSLISAGRSSAEVNSIVIQLGQALTSGRLMGDEFRSLSENLPREALEAFAKQLGVGVDELKNLSSQGKITTDVIRKAFADLANDMDETFSKSIPTIGQSLTVLNNKFIEFTASTSSGAALISKAIMFIGDNLNVIIPIIGAFAAAWLAIKAVAILTEIVAGITVLVGILQVGAAAVLLFVSPWTLLAAAILAVVVAVAIVTGQMDGLVKTVSDFTGKLWESITSQTGFNEVAGQAASTAATLSSGFAGLTSQTSSMTAATNDNKAAVKDWSSSSTKAINTVTEAYNRLSYAAREAASAAGAAQFKKNDPGVGKQSTSGSFTTLGRGSGMGGDSIRRFASGGSFRVGGKAGVDRNVVQFRASGRERVDILTPAQQAAQERARKNDKQTAGGPPTYIFNITTPDADSFRMSRQQLANDTFAAVN